MYSSLMVPGKQHLLYKYQVHVLSHTRYTLLCHTSTHTVGMVICYILWYHTAALVGSARVRGRPGMRFPYQGATPTEKCSILQQWISGYQT